MCVCMSVCLFVRSFVRLFVCASSVFVCLCVSMLVRLFVCLCVCASPLAAKDVLMVVAQYKLGCRGLRKLAIRGHLNIYCGDVSKLAEIVSH